MVERSFGCRVVVVAVEGFKCQDVRESEVLGRSEGLSEG